MEKKIFSVRFPHKLFNFLPFEKQIQRIANRIVDLEKPFQPNKTLDKKLVSLVLFDQGPAQFSAFLAFLGELSSFERQLVILCSSSTQGFLSKLRVKAKFIILPANKGLGDIEIKEIGEQIKNTNASFFWDFSANHHPLDLFLGCQSGATHRINFHKEQGKPFINLRFPVKHPSPHHLRTWFSKDFRQDFFWQYQDLPAPISKGNEAVFIFDSSKLPKNILKFTEQLRIKNHPIRFIDDQTATFEDLHKTKFLIGLAKSHFAQLALQMGWCPVIILSDEELNYTEENFSTNLKNKISEIV